ncbi:MULTISPECIES: ABC transporter substrate-binding protein [unclassified Streptomyces]|uniref:ABC transporter substrate-binding protein n=1 Tax=unclassified Streptomyces TaxID=2593676 RepID=UPI00225AA927|nr:ABC transporter substrate-binding protein [Streptomyces sp. NBC_00198]MCX5285844.1 ABC transporter substrate-binding protein [Streptomyces sp. NBC_00198]
MSPTRRLTTSAAALALLTATGCVSDGPGGPNLVIMANVTDRVAMSTVITAFRESHPNIRVKVTYADTGVLQKELPRQLKAGKGPDVFTVWPGSGNPASAETLADNNLLQDLTLHRYAWDLPEDVMSVAGSGGHIDIVPASYSAIGAIYAIGALKSIGGRPPTTFTQVLDLCDRARKHGKVLFALGNKTPWVTQLVSYSLAAGTVYATQPNFASDMALHHTSFAQSPWREALQKYLQMNERGCFSRDPLGTTYEQSLDQVASGKAVGVVQVASALAELRSATPGISLSMHALPASDDPAQTRMPAAVSAAYGLNVHPAHEKEAKAFVDFLASARGQNLYNSKGTTLPAIPDGTFKSDPAVAEVARRQKDETTVPFMDQRWPNSTVQQVHFQQIHDLFAGTTSVPSALKAMDRAFSDSTLN